MDINKCIELYKMMAQRCENSGLAKNQAKVYYEMIDFIADCDSVEDSMSKIKNSKYYFAPSVALMQDKLNAWKSAAIENDMPEIVNEINKKLSKIELDNSEIYVAGYEQTIQKYKNEYINTMQAFASIFDSYLAYVSTAKDYNLSDLQKHIKNLKRPSNNFEDLYKLKKFRNLIPVNDEGYKIFVGDIKNYINCGTLKSSVINDNFDIESNTKIAWDEIKDLKKDIIEIGKSYDNPSFYRHQLPEMKAIAPDIDLENPANIEGLHYTYTDLDNAVCSKGKEAAIKAKSFFSKLKGGE